MRIAVIGASGWLGGAIAREALSRGHQVTAMGRSPERLAKVDGATANVVDATDADALTQAIDGHDAVVSSVTDRSGPDRSTIPATTRALIEAVPRAGVSRLAVMGGGGSLLGSDGGRLVDQPGFPGQHKAEALAGAESLELLRGAPATLDWTFLSPPPQDLHPGSRRGGYRVRGDDRPVVDEQGHSSISAGDLPQRWSTSSNGRSSRAGDSPPGTHLTSTSAARLKSLVYVGDFAYCRSCGPECSDDRAV